MAATGTLSGKTDLADARAAAARGKTLSESWEQDTPNGRVVFSLLVIFTFISLGQPQSLMGEAGKLPYAQFVILPAILLHLAAMLSGRVKHRMTFELKLVLALTAWFLLGLPSSIWKGGSMDELTDEWFKTLIVFYLLSLYLVSVPRARKIFWTLYLSGLLATGVSLLLVNPNRSEDQRFLGFTVGMFGGNYLGITMSVILPFMAWTFMHAGSFFKRLVLIVCFSSMIALTIRSASRGGMIGLVISFVLVWITQLNQSAKGRLIAVSLAAGLAVSVALAPGAFWERVGTLWNSDIASSNAVSAEAADSELQRKALFWRSIEASAKHPVFGLGLNNFQVYSGSETGIGADWKGTHNTYTQLSAEAGIPAMIIFVVLLMSVLLKLRRIAKATAGNPELQEFSSLASASLVS